MGECSSLAVAKDGATCSTCSAAYPKPLLFRWSCLECLFPVCLCQTLLLILMLVYQCPRLYWNDSFLSRCAFQGDGFADGPTKSFDFSSFRRTPESRKTGCESLVWIPACAGMTVSEQVKGTSKNRFFASFALLRVFAVKKIRITVSLSILRLIQNPPYDTMTRH